MNAEDIEKRLATLTNACASLEADVAVLTAGPRDFAVKFEHKDAKESHLGSRCRGLGTLVTSCSWLVSTIGPHLSLSLRHAEWTRKVPRGI